MGFIKGTFRESRENMEGRRNMEGMGNKEGMGK
jgi:hypothetical protein